MSHILGKNDAYINKIENKTTLPSLELLFYICEYFEITPQEFFDEGNRVPERLNGIIEDLKLLDDKALEGLSVFIKGTLGKSKSK